MKLSLFLLSLLVLPGCFELRSGRVEGLKALLEEREPPDELILTFFDVGLGDAILIELPGGRTLLIDAGIGWRVEAILNYLEARGIHRLDGLLLTHPHPDHYGGMARILEKVPVGAFYHNGVRSRRASYERLEKALEARGIPRQILRRGDTLDDLTGSQVSMEVLYPDEAALKRGGNHNHATIVLRLVHGSVRVLLTGDTERAEEKRLLSLEGWRLRCQVLKLGHHASPGSGTGDFLRAVRPQLAIAQGTGFINVPLFYPRPNYRIRRILKREQAVVLTTREEGAIQLISDGTRFRVRTEAGTRSRDPRELFLAEAADLQTISEISSPPTSVSR